MLRSHFFARAAQAAQTGASVAGLAAVVCAPEVYAVRSEGKQHEREFATMSREEAVAAAEQAHRVDEQRQYIIALAGGVSLSGLLGWREKAIDAALAAAHPTSDAAPTPGPGG